MHELENSAILIGKFFILRFLFRSKVSHLPLIALSKMKLLFSMGKLLWILCLYLVGISAGLFLLARALFEWLSQRSFIRCNFLIDLQSLSWLNLSSGRIHSVRNGALFCTNRLSNSIFIVDKIYLSGMDWFDKWSHFDVGYCRNVYDALPRIELSAECRRWTWL